MKKCLLFAMAGLMAMPAFSQAEEDPIYLLGFYSQRISPNGRFVASMADAVGIYDIQTNFRIDFEGSFLGLGNAISNNGIAVGSDSNQSLIMKSDGSFVPDCLENYAFSSFNAITPDGSRACGFVGQGIEGLVPFYVDLDENGVAGELHILPHPDKDFLGSKPTYILACGISSDGK